jgi:hypothetical protein
VGFHEVRDLCATPDWLDGKGRFHFLGFGFVLGEDHVKLPKRLELDVTDLAPFGAICVDPDFVMVAMQEREYVLAVELRDDLVAELLVCKKKVDHWCLV